MDPYDEQLMTASPHFSYVLMRSIGKVLKI